MFRCFNSHATTAGDEDGGDDDPDHVTPAELFSVFQLLLGGSMPDDIVQVIVDNILERLDADGDGQIDMDELASELHTVDIESKLTIRF